MDCRWRCRFRYTRSNFICGIFENRKASARAAEISAIGGFISFLVLYFGGIEDSIMAAGAWSVLIGVAIMWIAAALFKNRVPVSKEKDNVL